MLRSRRGSQIAGMAVLWTAVAVGGCGAKPNSASPQAKPDASATRATSSPKTLTVYHNGKIYTASTDPKAKWAEAMAVAGDRIVKVGKSADVLRESPGASLIDLRGRTVVPGFNDAHHHHIPDPGSVHTFPPPFEPSLDEVREVIAADAAKKDGRFIVVEVGLRVLSDPAFGREKLDAMAPANPVFVRAYWGHDHVLNSKALAKLGIRDDVKDPPGGKFGRTKDGKLNGHAYEYAEWITGRRLAEAVTPEELSAQIGALGDQAAHFGVTSIQNMSWSPSERYLSAFAARSGMPRMRWINWPGTIDEAPLPAGTRGDRITINGLKLLMDGTPFERDAAVSFPYADGPGKKPRFGDDEVRRFLGIAQANGQPVLFHAVGDLAIETVLRAAEAVPADARAKLRPRIEHGDWVLPQHDERIKRISGVVVANPLHFTLVELLLKRFGPERKSMRLASLARGGVHVALGSDGPLNPFVNIMLATIHPYRPDEAVTREEAVDMYTREAAYAELQEANKGTLEAGKLADFAVLSQDIFTCPPPALPETASLLTVIGGTPVAGEPSKL